MNNNLFKEGFNEGGRPPIYDNPIDLLNKCNEYFNQNTKYTVTGLGLFLGFSSRSTLNEYEKKDGFSNIVKRAKYVVENGYEEALMDGSPTGAIFALKNMGWKDKTEQEVTQTNMEVGIDELSKEDKELIVKTYKDKY